MPFRLKRVYASPDREDGMRVLVDRLWPRGLSKGAAKIDLWAKDIAPSHELRKWFDHDPARWDGFQTRYATEIENQTETLALLQREAKQRTVTLLYGSREANLNNAAALKRLLEE